MPKQKTKNNNSKSKQKQGQQRSPKQASVAAAYATRSEGRAPVIKSSRDTCRITHREFIGNINGSNLFSIAQNLSVNPGLSSTFPWLSIMAQAWEQYKFEKLKFVFLTRTGSNTPGSVIMSPDYDSSDVAPISEQVMTTYDGTREDAPWKDNSCVLKTNLLSGAGGPRKFVRTGALQPNQDIKLYDVANMFVATVDGVDGTSWGKLWVEYDVHFWVPQLPPTGPLGVVGGLITGAGTLAPSNPLGSLPIPDPQSNGISSNGSSIVTVRDAGTYLVNNLCSGTGLTNLSCTNVSGTSVNNFASQSSVGTTIVSTTLVTVNVPGGQFSVSAVGTTVTSSFIRIAIAPPSSLN